ncbi:MAG: PAS domain S-box protein [Oscillospiraceae bacterium]|nr:PAS domain S-box protein [Oscillospiraceae bacterium]
MTSKIFKSILSVVIAVLMSSLIIVTGVLYKYFGNAQETQLKDELSLVAIATEELGKSYLENLDSDRYRLTWVNNDGTVIFDSHADISVMSNHLDREEIKEAFLYGAGSSSRQSSTLTEQTIYEAIRLKDGSVLRISVSRATALVLVIDMLQPVTVILVLAIGMSALLANRMAKRVVEPLNKLNLEEPMENVAYEELSPLLNRIHAQHQEIKSQMQALKNKQNEFEQITDNMNEALVLLDNSGKVVSVNPAAKNLFGVDDGCIGKDFLSIDHKKDIRQAIVETIECGHVYFYSKKNGRDYQFDLSRIDSSSGVHGLVILAFDITDQVNAEKHRQEFTANVSHELKTPLQSIIGSAELMENGIVKEEDMPRFLSHIRKEASRLVYLIEDIIRLSQLDEGAEMPREDVSLLAISEEICNTLADSATKKNVSLVIAGDNGIIHGVRRLLYEIIYNLCDNAIKYNNPGGTVTVNISDLQDTVKISVSDTGIGMAPEHHDKVFERFYRVDKSHSKQSGGTGLGLSIVKHAVQYHHGKITIESELNKGTTVSVLFDKKS